MYLNFTVAVPDVPGKITIRKMGRFHYVHFETERTYDAKRKFNIPKRTVIGKRCEDDPGRMIPNEKFLEIFPKTIVPEERPKSYRSCCLKLGAHLVISKIVEHYKLDEILSQPFEDDVGFVLDLVSYLIVDEENAGQYYPDFAFTHPLFTDGMRILSDSSVSRFFSGVTKDQIVGFLNEWNAKQDHRQRIYVSYDSTNKNCQAGDIDIVEFGKAKEDKGLPIFNLAVAYDKTNKVPLFYEEYPGSINDVSQFQYLVDKVSEYGYRSIGFVLDRGYFSRSNIERMDQENYQFVIMCKGCKLLVSSLIEQNRGHFETDRKCFISNYHVYGTTTKMPLFQDDIKDRWFHLYFNPEKMAAERENFESELDRAKLLFRKVQGRAAEFEPEVNAYFDCHYKEGKAGEPRTFLFASEKTSEISRRLNLCGYFCIVSSEKMTAEEAFLLYKGRDVSEKLFRADKTFLGSKSMRVCSNEAASAKLFVEFVALIVRNRIYNLLKEEIRRLNVKKNFMTVPAAIKELEKIEMRRTNNGAYRLDHAITKNQRMILQSFGITEEDVRRESSRISAILTKLKYDEKTDPQGDEDAQTQIDEEH